MSDTPQKIWDDVAETGALIAKIGSFIERVAARKEMREKESARIQALIDAKATEHDELVALAQAVADSAAAPIQWSCLITEARTVLAKVREKGG